MARGLDSQIWERGRLLTGSFSARFASNEFIASIEAGRSRHEKRSAFFFEKKNQKTFIPKEDVRLKLRFKSLKFFASFFQKRRPSLSLPSYASHRRNFIA